LFFVLFHNDYLFLANGDNKIVVDIITQSERWKEMDKYKLTEDEIKNYEVNNYWKYAEEVKD